MMKPVKFAHTIKMDFNESEQNTFKHRSANVQNSEMINPDVMKFFYSPIDIDHYVIYWIKFYMSFEHFDRFAYHFHESIRKQKHQYDEGIHYKVCQ